MPLTYQDTIHIRVALQALIRENTDFSDPFKSDAHNPFASLLYELKECVSRVDSYVVENNLVSEISL